MATQAYYTWVGKGRPYTIARPIQDLVSMARAAGIPILGIIGNDAHLTANYPEDHTPYSFTAWPVPLPGYIVTACDIQNGPWSERLLQMCKDGRAPWAKYLNFAGRNYSVKRGWSPVSNSDQHLHVSCRTDQLNTQVTANPFVAGSGGVMATAEEIIKAWSVGNLTTPDGKSVEPVKWRISDEAFQRSVMTKLGDIAVSANRPFLTDEQITVLAQRLASETSAETIESALRTVLKEGVDQ